MLNESPFLPFNADLAFVEGMQTFCLALATAPRNASDGEQTVAEGARALLFGLRVDLPGGVVRQMAQKKSCKRER